MGGQLLQLLWNTGFLSLLRLSGSFKEREKVCLLTVWGYTSWAIDFNSNLSFSLSFSCIYLPFDQFSSSFGSVVVLRHCDFLLVCLLLGGQSLRRKPTTMVRTLMRPEVRSTGKNLRHPASSHGGSLEIDSLAPDDNSQCLHLENSWNPRLEPSSKAALHLPFRNCKILFLLF